MQSEIIKATKGSMSADNGGPLLPAIIAQAGDHAARRFIEFFTATIRNANARTAYARAVTAFLAWCEDHRLTLPGIEPVHVAAYITLTYSPDFHLLDRLSPRLHTLLV